MENMNLHEKQGVPFLTFPALEEYPYLLHAFSTRQGGVSQGEFSTMNLCFNRGDKDENVLENYRRICGAVGFAFDGLTASSQDHHTVIRRVGKEHAGLGITRPRDRTSVDGLCTNEPGITLVTYYADCVPLFFLDPDHRAVGLCHAGWRGTVDRIGACMVEMLRKEFGSDPRRLVAAIGPSIGPCCYEVDAPVAERFLAMNELRPEEFAREKEDGKFMLDLWECNRRVLMAAGIPADSIHTAKLCTKCNHELLYSHRIMGNARGGLAAMMELKEGLL